MRPPVPESFPPLKHQIAMELNGMAGTAAARSPATRVVLRRLDSQERRRLLKIASRAANQPACSPRARMRPRVAAARRFSCASPAVNGFRAGGRLTGAPG